MNDDTPTSIILRVYPNDTSQGQEPNWDCAFDAWDLVPLGPNGARRVAGMARERVEAESFPGDPTVTDVGVEAPGAYIEVVGRLRPSTAADMAEWIGSEIATLRERIKSPPPPY